MGVRKLVKPTSGWSVWGEVDQTAAQMPSEHVIDSGVTVSQPME